MRPPRVCGPLEEGCGQLAGWEWGTGVRVRHSRARRKQGTQQWLFHQEHAPRGEGPCEGDAAGGGAEPPDAQDTLRAHAGILPCAPE